jgi:hypothetical protein
MVRSLSAGRFGRSLRFGHGFRSGRGVRPGITTGGAPGMVIAGRPGVTFVPDFGEPAVHLTPVRLLEHVRVVRPDLDLHIAPPVKPAASSV